MLFFHSTPRHLHVAALACAALFGFGGCAPGATQPPEDVPPDDAGRADEGSQALSAADGGEGHASSGAGAPADGGAALGCIQGCPSPVGTPCGYGLPLAGITYDITKSRFAFGSTPAVADAGTLVEWTGSDGDLVIHGDGSETAVLNAGAPEQALADWSSDGNALTAHAAAYLGAMGLEACQDVGFPDLFVDNSGASVPTTRVSFHREILYVEVVDSSAVVRFDANDETTYESIWWPEIPADVVAAARALVVQWEVRGWPAYQAKLPPNAQGPGVVVIHHSSAASTRPFVAVAVYRTFDSTQSAPAELDFDADGNPVADTWSAP